MLLDPKTRKFISDHVGTFIVAGVAVIGPLLGTYEYLYSEFKSLSAERVAFERDKATALIDVEKKRLEIEKLQAQLSIAVESTKTLMDQAHKKELQVTADNERLQENWKTVQQWRQKLSPEQEYRQLVDEFTQLSVDLSRCPDEKDIEKHNKARVLTKRILYAAGQTNNADNISFAKSIQPILFLSSCFSRGK